MKHFIGLLLVGLLGTASGCAYASAPVTGFLFTNVRSAVSATPNTRGDKHGQSTSASILGLIAFGESSINAAANRGNITKISHVDTQVFSFLGIYASYTVHVYGE